MVSWTSHFDGIFFLSLASLIFGFLGLSVRYCLKSKCETFNACCGLIHIERRVDLEVQHELAQLELGNQENEEIQTKNTPNKKKNITRHDSISSYSKNDLEIKVDE
jgi:hypothetical protein